MGRYSWSSRKIVEDCLVLNISDLRRKKSFQNGLYGTITWSNSRGEVKHSIGISVVIYPNARKSGQISLTYSSTNALTNEKTDLSYSVSLEPTPCNFGGKRYWFICPLMAGERACKRRVGKLYLPPGRKHFGCRHCHKLTYQCQREHDKSLDLFMKNPLAFAGRKGKGNDIKTALLTFKAMRKLEKSGRI